MARVKLSKIKLVFIKKVHAVQRQVIVNTVRGPIIEGKIPFFKHYDVLEAFRGVDPSFTWVVYGEQNRYCLMT